MTAPAIAAVGELDTRFGTAGVATIQDNSGPTVLELPDGRIVVAGRTTSQTVTPQLTLHRYLASGAPDESFGTSGRVLLDLRLPELSYVTAAALQPDGKIVIAGNYWMGGLLPFVARVDSSGSLDAGFGTGGVVAGYVGATEPYYSSLVVTNDGEILAAISDWTSDRIDRFAADGRYLGNLAPGIAPHMLVQQSDGRLIVSGYHRESQRSVVTRMDTRGNRDASFGSGGLAEVGRDYTGHLSIEPGGDRIVLCGPGIVRLTADGQPDLSFGVQGTGSVSFRSGDTPSFDYCQGVLALRGGGVVYVGVRSIIAGPASDQVWIGGLTADGRMDTRFGSGQGATELALFPVRGSPDFGFDESSALIPTRSGDALLTWRTSAGNPELLLARIDLGSGALAGPAPTAPPAAPSPSPPTTPAPTATPTPAPSAMNGGHGGGGALGWLGLILFALVGAAAVTRANR